MGYTTMDRGTLMDLSMTNGEKVSHSWNNVSTIAFNYNFSQISLKPSIYSFVPLIDLKVLL